MENNTIHALSIINGDVKLDGFTVKGVIDYNLKASGKEGTTINLTLLVKSQELVVTNEKEVAPEVSVLEQCHKPIKTIEFVNKELETNLSQKQYDDLAILDLCTRKYTAFEMLKILKILNII